MGNPHIKISGVIFGSLTLFAAWLIFSLPETKNFSLQQSLAEIESKFQRSEKISNTASSEKLPCKNSEKFLLEVLA